MKIKRFKVGDFVRCTNFDDTGLLYWIGIVVRTIKYNSVYYMDVTLSHRNSYFCTVDFQNTTEDIFHKFNPTKNDLNRIMEAVEHSFATHELDNLSYIEVLNNLRKYKIKKHSKRLVEKKKA